MRTRGGHVNFHINKVFGPRYSTSGKIVKSKLKNLLTLNIDQYQRLINFHPKLTSDYYQQFNSLIKKNNQKLKISNSNTITVPLSKENGVENVEQQKECDVKSKIVSQVFLEHDDTTQDFFGVEEIVESTQQSLKPYKLKRTQKL